MQRSSSAVVSNIGRHILRSKAVEWPQNSVPPCDVFINHRGVDTKRNVAGLLYHHLRSLRLRPFLDSKSMKPGDKLFDKIDVAIRELPVFCDVKPSELRVKDDGSCPPKDLDKFQAALEEAKNTVGLTFDTLRGDWPEFLANATDVVIKNLIGGRGGANY
ncbi:UNVERIFIED_CONTAM: TIR-only protein [Sesamum angustifolium]|uniref:TIR-only protein n=1 Tax=Sesamum angustifolium TaxID=2727405 RepID=A0AAW2PAC2_9LAMI